MQLATERRDPQTMRVPLDDVLINLSPEGFDEYFAADAVNVGVGGLSMRSAILPDVGAKLSCRFQSPHDGSAVNADCEVVWSQAQGSNVGEFGLRFTGMTSQDQESIEQLVYSWNEDLLPSLGPESYGSSPGAQSVRIELDGVGQAVEADVSHRAEDALVVEQKLPFLRVGTGISEGGRRGTLQSVDLRIEDDLPRLVLTIWYDDHSQGGEPSSDDRSEDTLMEGSLRGENLSVEIAEPEVAEREASEPGSIHEMKRESATQVRYDADDEVARLSDDEAESIAAQLKPDIRRSLRQAGERLRPLWSRFRALMVTLWVKAGPRVRGIAGRIRTFSALLWARSMGGIKGLWAKARKRSTTQVHSKKRRVQAARRATSGTVETASPTRRRGAGRLVAGAVLVVGLAAIAASVMGDSGVTAKLVQPKPEPLVDPELGDESFAAEPEAIAPTVAPGEVPAASPYATEASDVGSEAAESADRFESGSLDNARSYTLRMSLPPRGVRGQDTEDGIRVVILGSNAIDGARRIASADPRVEAASILNHGEEAELRLRFTDGERPGYRIESRSSTLVISIGD